MSLLADLPSPFNTLSNSPSLLSINVTATATASLEQPAQCAIFTEYGTVARMATWSSTPNAAQLASNLLEGRVQISRTKKVTPGLTKVQLRVRVDRSDSPLRNELQPEDIEDVEEVDWNKLMEDFEKPLVEEEIDGGTFMDFFEDHYGFWGPSIEFIDADMDISSLQISDMEAKDESLNDSGYSSAEPDEPDEEIQKELTWDFEYPDVPSFPPDEDEPD
ncbi:pH-response regulator protein palF/RIM8 [Venturia inaequalis]|nr:pH-response regulator protein palF/RIM8 [Venturia inaequalis]